MEKIERSKVIIKQVPKDPKDKEEITPARIRITEKPKK